MSVNDEDRLWQLFRKEVAERTQAMLQALTSVEQGTPPNPETLDTLHREAHTLKGAAGVMGQQDLYELGESIESTLRDAKQAGTLDPATATTLIQSTQRLISLVQGR